MFVSFLLKTKYLWITFAINLNKYLPVETKILKTLNGSSNKLAAKKPTILLELSWL